MESSRDFNLTDNNLFSTERFPVELLIHIFSYLDRSNFINASCVCRLFYKITNNVARDKKFFSFCTKYGNTKNAIVKLPENYFAVGSRGGTISIWDYGEGYGHKNVLSITKLSPNELASASADGTIGIWDFRKRELLKILNCENSQCNWAYGVIDLGNNEIGSCHDDGFRVWNYKTGLCLRTISLAADQVRKINEEAKCIAATKLSNNQVACGYGNETVRI